MPLCHYGSLILDMKRFGQFSSEFRRRRLKDRTGAVHSERVALSLSPFLFRFMLSTRIISRSRNAIEGSQGSHRSISLYTRPGTLDNLYTSRKSWEQKRRYLGVRSDRYLRYRDTVVNCRVF